MAAGIFVYKFIKLIVMFLNLKSKKMADSTLNIHIKNQSNLNSYREGTKERQNRQSRQIKSTRQHHNPNHKKPTISTAISTLTANPNSYTTIKNHCKNHSQESKQKELIEECHHSRQKIDSIRIANVYKKIKKLQTPENVVPVDSLERDVEKGKKNQNVSQRLSNKKQLLNTITNKFMCTTENDERDNIRIEEEIDKNYKNQLVLMLQPFLQLFSWQLDSKETVSVPLRTRVHSKEGDIHRSIQNSHRNNSKEGKKRSNDLLIRETNKNANQGSLAAIHDSISKFMYKMEQTQYKIKSFESESKLKYVEQPCYKIMQKLLESIEYFILQIYQKCLKEMDRCHEKFQTSLAEVIREQVNMEKKCGELESFLMTQKQNSNGMKRMLEEARNKSIFAEAIIAEVSRLVDIDTFIRGRLEEEFEAQSKGNNNFEKVQYNNAHFQIVQAKGQKVHSNDEKERYKLNNGLGNYKQLRKTNNIGEQGQMLSRSVQI